MISTPKAPDPQETANAQAGMNRDTAITQQQLNMVDQTGPYGSLAYTQTGTNKFKNAEGQWVETPKYTATTTLTPQQQKILNQTQAANLNLGTIANERSSFLKSYLAKPFDVNAQTEAKINELGSARLDPRFAKQQDQMRTQLISSGIRPGTAAYSAAMNDFEQSRNDAYNQLALTGRQQAFNEASYERAQPLNEISALLSGSQVTQPTFQSTPQASVGGVDYTGLVQNKFQAENQASQAKLGGLFGLLSGGIGMLSDVRAKEDIATVGKLDNGLPVYVYRYKGSPEYHIGLMAQDVEIINPSAVSVGQDGLKRVRYDLATEVI